MIALLLACCASALSAEPTRVDGYAEALDRGWLEAVITVRHPQAVLQLAEQVAAGDRAVALFVIQRMDCEAFSACADLDPAFARGLEAAATAGVLVPSQKQA